MGPLVESPAIWRAFARQTPSSPSPSSSSGCSSAGARATCSRARSPSARARPLWSFYEGPPTANGKPHSGHVLSRVFKDIYPRYHAMAGERVPRKGGWDCHGLPVELEIERELGISSKAEIEEFGIAEFNAKCRESVFRYVEDWKRLSERIGFWIDMDEPYVTMDDDYIESVWWALRRMWDDGRLYEGHKVVPYCPRCGTALSSHEVADRLPRRRGPLGVREAADRASPRPATRSPSPRSSPATRCWSGPPLPGR